MTTFSERVYATVRRIPSGRIVSYGGVAALIGKPRAARGVGYALSHLPHDTDVPWWRVVNRRGAISTTRINGVAQRQRAILEGEGVEFDERGEASWERFGWDPHGEGGAANGELAGGLGAKPGAADQVGAKEDVVAGEEGRG